jgi:hypothetical protein
MYIRYKGWSIHEPIIGELSNGSGYSILGNDISRDDGPAREIKILRGAGIFNTRAAARSAAIAGTKRFIDKL